MAKKIFTESCFFKKEQEVWTAVIQEKPFLLHLSHQEWTLLKLVRNPWRLLKLIANLPKNFKIYRSFVPPFLFHGSFWINILNCQCVSYFSNVVLFLCINECLVKSRLGDIVLLPKINCSDSVDYTLFFKAHIYLRKLTLVLFFNGIEFSNGNYFFILVN